MKNLLHKIYCRLRPGYWHNRVFPRDFSYVVHHAQSEITLTLGKVSHKLPLAKQLARQFQGQGVHVVLSGPSVNSIESPAALNESFCVAVNGSPAFFTKHQLKIDAYFVDDPRFIKDRLADLLLYFEKAGYIFLSIQNAYLLMELEVDLGNYPIYIFDYQRFPALKKRGDKQKALFATDFNDGIDTCNTIAYVVLQVTYILGFAEVALFGLDLTMDGRFYKEANTQPQYLNENWQEGIIEPFERVKSVLENTTWSVINCSPNSRLPSDLLPKMEPNLYLAERAGQRIEAKA